MTVDWADLVAIDSVDLAPGNVVVSLATGTAYTCTESGAVTGVGFMPCNVVTTFTVIEVTGDEVTALRDNDRRQVTQRVPAGHKSLILRQSEKGPP